MQRNSGIGLFAEPPAIDEAVKSPNFGWWCRKFKFKARKSQRREAYSSAPQRLRDAAQRRNWTFYAAIRY
jgi:hypothetical protein